MTTSQPLVSILVPVYEGADTLRECLESILAQTYTNWECTVVDNCSTDGSSALAYRYAAMDSRIRVHENQEFLPALANHNATLRRMSPTSKYCKVVFADDWIFPECLEKMVANAEANPSVGLVGAYCLEGRRVTCAGLPYSTTILSGREICRRHLLNQLYVFGSANSVLYRSDLVRSRDPFYNEANIHGDTEVCFALLKTCDFGFVHQVLTYSRVRERSLTTTSTDLHTEFGGMLHLLVTHGADYLTREEFQRRLRHHVASYYRFLSRSLVFGREQAFWDYHKSQFTLAGLDFSHRRLFGATLNTLYKGVLRPLDSIYKFKRARREWRQRRIRSNASHRAAGLKIRTEPSSGVKTESVDVRGTLPAHPVNPRISRASHS